MNKKTLYTTGSGDSDGQRTVRNCARVLERDKGMIPLGAEKLAPEFCE
jgi:hypothetical protein